MDKFRFTQVEARDAAALLAARLTLVEPVPLGGPVSRDPDDDVVLATALAGECRCIITGDKYLLVLKRFQEIPILSPSEFWRYETELD